jgi:spore coat polysaccharide biosynthesis predicted glycosyltransferase SpsG
MGWSLGVFHNVTDHHLVMAVNRLLADVGVRRQMSSQSRQSIDGQGARRIAEIVVDRAGKL